MAIYRKSRILRMSEEVVTSSDILSILLYIFYSFVT